MSGLNGLDRATRSDARSSGSDGAVFERLARFSLRFRWAVVIAWIAGAVVANGALPGRSSIAKTNSDQFLSSSRPSVYAVELATPFQGKCPSARAIIVASIPSGRPIAEDLAAIRDGHAAVRGGAADRRLPGVILAGTFAMLGIAGGCSEAQQLGYSIAFGVLLDTLFGRSLLIPPIAMLLGPLNCWPSTAAHAIQCQQPDLQTPQPAQWLHADPPPAARQYPAPASPRTSALTTKPNSCSQRSSISPPFSATTMQANTPPPSGSDGRCNSTDSPHGIRARY
jgi:hypothetical protein